MKTMSERLADKFMVGDDCWVWTAAKDTTGYGRVNDGERVVPAHRAMYELLVGPIPEGLYLDHLCRVRACIRPSHLEPVTRQENFDRAPDPNAPRHALTHCKQGHEFSPENTYQRGIEGRGCRACNADVQRRRRAAA